MRKEPRKTEKNNSDFENTFKSINLAPPKVYRENSRNASDKATGRRKSTENQTKSERRNTQNKKRKRKLKIRKIVLCIALVLILVAVGVALSLTVFFKIETISVSGESIYSSEEIIDDCSFQKGNNLFLIDKEKTVSNLKKELPYVYNAEITRHLPNKINIKITEATESYAIGTEDKTFIVLDDDFKVLKTGEKEKPKTAILITEAEVKSAEAGKSIEFKNNTVSKCLTELSVAIKENKLSEATGIYSKGIDDNYIVYDNRIKFQLGTTDNLDTKINRGLASVDKMNQTNTAAKGTMNLQYDKQIYFTEE